MKDNCPGKMGKGVTILFVIFNIAQFLFLFFGVVKIPGDAVVFGWMPAQMAALFIQAPIGAVVWGLYFISFLNKQRDV